MSKTNFDIFLEAQLRDPDFAERVERAGEAWDVALQLAALREKATQDLSATYQPARIAVLRRPFPEYAAPRRQSLERKASTEKP